MDPGTFYDWKNKKVYLIGAGKSGLAAAGWLRERGAVITLNDSKPADAFGPDTQEALTALAAAGVALELGRTAAPLRRGADYVIASPGVPLDLPGISEATAAGIPVTNEIELGWQACHARIVGVTGSNGKTTVTSLIGEIMSEAGLCPFIGGNIGTPFIRATSALRETDWAVLELSSFQLEGILSLAPKVAVFLNLSPDHLDRHKSFTAYAAAKWKIAAYQGPDDCLVLNYDDPLLREEGTRRLRAGESHLYGQAPAGGPGILWFGRSDRLEGGISIDGQGWVVYRQPTQTTAAAATVVAAETSSEKESAAKTDTGIRIMPLSDFSLPGVHNTENLLAAIGASISLGITPDVIRRSAGAFRAIAHRLETVGEYEGVLYVNDSKATNPDSAIKAMDSFDRPILLIAGGDGKGVSFRSLAEKIAKKAKLVALVGMDRERIREALADIGFAAVYMTGDIGEATGLCRDMAEPGDMVLLAPACSSLDMYSSYEERGAIFKDTVRALYSRDGLLSEDPPGDQ